MSSNSLSRQDIHNGGRIRRWTRDGQKVVNSVSIGIRYLNGMFSIPHLRCLLEGWARANDSRRFRVGWSAIISFLHSCFWAYICFRLYWRSSRQVRNVGIVDPVLPVTNDVSKTSTYVVITGRSKEKNFSERTEFNDGKSSSTPRISAFNDDNTDLFSYTTMCLRSPRWNMTNKCQSCSVVSSTMCTAKMLRHYGFLPLTASFILPALVVHDYWHHESNRTFSSTPAD